MIATKKAILRDSLARLVILEECNELRISSRISQGIHRADPAGVPYKSLYDLPPATFTGGFWQESYFNQAGALVDKGSDQYYVKTRFLFDDLGMSWVTDGIPHVMTINGSYTAFYDDVAAVDDDYISTRYILEGVSFSCKTPSDSLQFEFDEATFVMSANNRSEPPAGSVVKGSCRINRTPYLFQASYASGKKVTFTFDDGTQVEQYLADIRTGELTKL